MRTSGLFDLGKMRDLFAANGERDDNARRIRERLSEDGRLSLRSETARNARGVHTGGSAHQDRATLSGRWERAPWTGSADGGVERTTRGGVCPRGPAFDRPIPKEGYRWHYVDGVSFDGAFAIVVIALVGNPFSPAYARARVRTCEVSPLTYSAMNVALYGPGGKCAKVGHARALPGSGTNVGHGRRSLRSLELGDPRATARASALVSVPDCSDTAAARPHHGGDLPRGARSATFGARRLDGPRLGRDPRTSPLGLASSCP